MARTAAPQAAAAAALFRSGGLPKIAWGEGITLVDSDGKRYLDGSSGPAVYCLGHGNREVNAAISEQLDRIAHGYRYTFTSDPLEQLQAIIAERCGGSLTQSVIVTGGSEAVESCLKIALQYQSAIGARTRRRFISRERSWHGNTLGALSISGFAERREPFEGALIESSRLAPVDAYRPPEGIAPEELAAHGAAELEAEILRLGPDRVCAFIFEPVVGAAGGCVPAPPGYAKLVREVCDRHGVLLIADEVMCGCGRTGVWRALEADGVEPDIMAIAKGLGGGYLPLGAAVFSERMAEAIMAGYGQVMTGHTFTGHTAACAAGVAVQTIVKRDRLVEKVAEDGPYLRDALHEALDDHPNLGDIRGRGFFLGIEIVADRGTKAPFDPSQTVFLRLRDQAFENGLICYPAGGNVDGLRGDHAILAPPFIATRDELDRIVELFAKSFRQVMASL